MIVGFTGTRKGMTYFQRLALAMLLHKLKPKEAHHGMCVGADTEFHKLVRNLILECKIVGHPPAKRQLFVASECDELWPEKDYIARDKDIVNESEVLVATPDSEEKLRSGTWTTVRYAREKKRNHYIIEPSGYITYIGK